MQARSDLRILEPLDFEFSLRTRQQNWQQLSKSPQTFDLIVIGGGIVGAGIAYEASAQGLKVALIEKNDFASGTSSKSSKLLHGGLRYLEQYEFGLVFEALSARNSLFDKFPHLTRKVPFLMPVYRHYEERAWFINLGCWLYDVFSWLSSPFHTIRHRWVDKYRLQEMEPHIKRENFEGGLQFYDAYCDDARLVIETLKTAHAMGATLFNYTQVTGFSKNQQGKVTSVHLQDELQGKTLELQGHKIINATGPWADHLNRLANPDEPTYLRPSKGIHLIIPRVTHQERAIMLKTIPDHAGVQRWMFIIPYGEYSIVGTTDTDYEGNPRSDYLDHDNYATAEDVNYLLASVNAIYPQAQLTPKDVVSSYGGWRPLVCPPGKTLHESDISRSHEIFETTSGITMLAGGKLTTYLYMAQDLLRYLHKQDPEHFKALKPNEIPPLCNRIQAHSPDELRERLQPWISQLPAERQKRLIRRYGTEVTSLMKLQTYFSHGLEPIAGLSEEVPMLALEVAYMVLHEQTLHLNDLLLRRQRVLLRDRQQGKTAARQIAELMAEVLGFLMGWNKETRNTWVIEELKAFEAELARTNQWQQEEVS